MLHIASSHKKQEEMSQDFKWTAEWAAKLKKTQEMAEKGEEGNVFFLEMKNANPICSMYLITGKISEDDKNKRDFHMHVEQEPRTYPYFPTSQVLIRNLAYQEYARRFQNRTSTTSSTFGMMSEAAFTRKFLEITVAADSSIRQTHGIMCYQDGDLKNHAKHNVFILHISDVLNIHMRKKMGLKTNLLIKTHSLSFIPDTTKNKFIEETLSTDMLMFLEENVDFFYRLYCYYANDSFVPVRTEVDIKCKVFKLSRFFMNDPFFSKHQKGKLSQFNQLNKEFESTLAYRSI
jgi:hypothetical protein